MTKPGPQPARFHPWATLRIEPTHVKLKTLRIALSIHTSHNRPQIRTLPNVQGQVEMEFAVAKDGRLRQVTVRRSSGVEILDRHAVMAVEAAAPFPAVPDQVSGVGIPAVAVFTYAIEAGR